jgi:hypothetical protein
VLLEPLVKIRLRRTQPQQALLQALLLELVERLRGQTETPKVYTA